MDMVMLPEFKHKYRLAENTDDPFQKRTTSDSAYTKKAKNRLDQ